MCRRNSGSWVMETWAHFLECWSVYIFRGDDGQPVLTPVQELWDCLRRGLYYYLRRCPLGDVALTSEEASSLLKKYGRLLHVHFGSRACSYNPTHACV